MADKWEQYREKTPVDKWEQYRVKTPEPITEEETNARLGYLTGNEPKRSLKDFKMPFLEGAAQTATSGLFDYVPAAIAKSYSVLKDPFAKTPQGPSFKEYLDATRARTADVQKESPTEFGLGQGAGILYSGARMIPAAAEVMGGKLSPWLGNTVANAAQGGVSGLAESGGNLYEGAKGALVGGAAGAAGSGVAKVAEKISVPAFEKAVTDRMLPIHMAAEKARTPVTQIDNNWINLVDQTMKESEKQSLGNQLRGLPRKAIESVASAVPDALVGGATGAAAGLIVGEDPYKYGVGGALTGVATQKLQATHKMLRGANVATGKFLMENPNALPTAAGVMGRVGTDLGNKSSEVPFNVMERWLNPTPINKEEEMKKTATVAGRSELTGK